ncbi:MAG: hypothetical protein R2806_14560 [Saprospiraceae bacterium]
MNIDRYPNYLMHYYLVPAANQFLEELNEDQRQEYLATNPWISWNERTVSFAFRDYGKARRPDERITSFRRFPMVQPEPKLFGDSTHPARHFTDLGVRFEMNNPNIHVDGETLQRTHLMNPMYLQIHHKGLAE